MATTMHDYVKGAFEALSWVQNLLLETDNVKRVMNEIDDALADIKEGVACDFRRKLQPIRYEIPYARNSEKSSAL